MTLDAFRSDLGAIKVEDNPKFVQKKSRDFYWYSPVLKRQLEGVSAELVVTPQSEAEVVQVLRAAYRHGVAITPRGAGTGNYGQAMPLSGGAILDLSAMDRIVHSDATRVRAQAGAILEKMDRHTKAEHGAEMRFFPSTYRTATIGGFVAGGSGGVGSIRWGGLRNFGNILGLTVVTCEEEPRVLKLEGADVLKVAHAYGTNGIITEVEIPLTAAYDWVGVILGFPDIIEACRFGEALGRQDGILVKEIAPVAAPVAHDYFGHHRRFIPRESSVVVAMVAPQSVEALEVYARHSDAKILFRSDRDAQGERLPPVFELCWNHTTMLGLKVDPSITYLQTQYPDLERVKRIHELLGDELPLHLEVIRFDGRVVFSGLPIVRFTTEERLEEIIAMHEENGCLVFNPHRYTLEEGGMKRTDRGQLAFKREADPKGILNPGKMVAWENPDFDFDSGRQWLFSGLQRADAA
ncbi:FAD-binding oxidoreductase [Aureimonas populi]|uniref:FAD-binding oxidoreductase n=1 Tax=Aureimonas populi TaxID=1701758 RepID=A0ABW5CLM8_9HYPH|nr:FAD-binding oxidoreductase [Aureimonas populi]